MLLHHQRYAISAQLHNGIQKLMTASCGQWAGDVCSTVVEGLAQGSGNKKSASAS